MPWIEWSPALESLLSGDVHIDVRALSVALRLQLKPVCARLLDSWLTMLPHPPADKRGWVALSELALDWGSKQAQQQDDENVDPNMARIAAAASGQLAESVLAPELQADDSLGKGLSDADMDMSIALMAADAVAARVKAEAQYEHYRDAMPDPAAEVDAAVGRSARQEHNVQSRHAEIVGSCDQISRATGTSVPSLTTPDDPHTDMATSNALTSCDSSGFVFNHGDAVSQCNPSDESSGEESEEEDEEIRRLRDELATLKSRRRLRHAQAQTAVDQRTHLDALPDVRATSAEGHVEGDSKFDAAVEPAQAQYQHPPSVGGWVVPKMRVDRD